MSEPMTKTTQRVFADRRPARVAVMLALAHKIQQAIDRGDVPDRAEAARRLGLTRARVSQLMNLTLLAPDIQEALLGLEAVDGVEPVCGHRIRMVVNQSTWRLQRERWAKISDSRCITRAVALTAPVSSGEARTHA